MINIEGRRGKRRRNKGQQNVRQFPNPQTPKQKYEYETQWIKPQPRWKWSYNAVTDQLIVWPTDKYGDPHHIEVTGSGFYKFAQGRIYVEGDGSRDSIAPDEHVNLMVWKNRGPEVWQPKAINKVNEWLIGHFNHPADEVTYRDEHVYWNTMKDEPTAQDINDWYTELKGEGDAGITDDYNSEHARRGTEPSDYIHQLVNKPIHEITNQDWNTEGNKNYAWTYDYGTGEFAARELQIANPGEDLYVKYFGDDGQWSAQGMIMVQDGYVTMIIDSDKPLQFEDSPTDLKRIQDSARDKGMKWIKDILNDHVDHVKWANEYATV